MANVSEKGPAAAGLPPQQVPASSPQHTPTPPTATPAVPYSIFTRRQKALIVTLVSIGATLSSFAANIYFPAIPTIAADLRVSTELVNLSITGYMIFQGLSPTLWGSLADALGRRITYFGTFAVFFGACVGLAKTRAYAQLVVLRCLQSTGSAATIAIGAGVLGDITTREERGGYMGVFQAALLVPLAAGPVLGGAFAGSLGWRAIFWFLTIYSGAVGALLALFLPETLRALVGNGSIPARGLAASPIAWFQRRRSSSLPPPSTRALPPRPPIDLLAPLRIVFSGEASFAIAFLTVYYTAWQMTIAALSTLLAQVYHLSALSIGLTFIANGAGCMLGTLTSGTLLDREYARFARRGHAPGPAFPLERARLGCLWGMAALELAGLLAFGWSVARAAPLAVPLVATFVLGWAAAGTQAVLTTYVVDVHPRAGASATAALNFARCLVGAGGSAAVMPLVERLGVGWAFTLLAGVCVVALGLVGAQMRWGARWRRQREEREKEEGGEGDGEGMEERRRREGEAGLRRVESVA